MLPPDPDSFLPAALEPEDQSAIGDLDNEVEADLDMDLFEPILVSRASVAVNPPGFPPIFQYSQDNLQAYTVCARRFQLRHLVRQAWPEPVTGAIDELEDELQIGDHFHRLVERHSLGIVVPPPIDTPLADWWQAFLHHPPRDLPTDPLIRKVEAFYSVPFGGRRLVAKFDLLAIVPGERVVIVDWKTSSRPPDRQLLAERWQTAVYLYVAAEALTREYGGALPPASISLIYWFAAAPDQPIIFQHSTADHERYRARLNQITDAIESRVAAGEMIWPLTDRIDRCQTCTFRVLCDRTATSVSDRSASAIMGDALPDLDEEPITLDNAFFDDTAEVEL